MWCPACGSTTLRERPERTTQGHRRFRCGNCGKQCNERSAGVLNRAQYPSDVIALVVLWRLRYKPSLRGLAEMFLTRGIVFSYEAVRDWEAKLTAALAENLRRRRKGRVGRSWYVDETYIRVRGQSRYLYRAIDRDGALVDVMLSEHRDLTAAKAFFRSAKAVTGVTPDRVTTDGHDAYPRAIRTELGKHVRHRMSRYRNNRLEQDHRGIKSRCRPMLGLKSTGAAVRFCHGHYELRNSLRCRSRMRQHIPAAALRRRHIRRRWPKLAELMAQKLTEPGFHQHKFGGGIDMWNEAALLPSWANQRPSVRFRRRLPEICSRFRSFERQCVSDNLFPSQRHGTRTRDVLIALPSPAMTTLGVSVSRSVRYVPSPRQK
jgi:putative transposase